MRWIARSLCCASIAALISCTATAKVAERSCVGFEAWKRNHPELSPQHRATVFGAITPSDPSLRQSLLAMEREDITARDAAISAQQDKHADAALLIANISKNDAAHLVTLKSIVGRDVFPDAHLIGLDGVEALFLLIQHADAAPALQVRALPHFERLARQGQIGAQQVALLTDRLLVNAHKPQRYGTQFISDPRRGGLKPAPLESLGDLASRRRELGLPPLDDYACLLANSYDQKVWSDP